MIFWKNIKYFDIFSDNNIVFFWIYKYKIIWIKKINKKDIYNSFI